MTGTTRKKKTTTTKGKVGRPRKKNQGKNQEDGLDFIRTEVVILASFAVAVLLLLSNFGLCGALGALLRQIQLGVFGIMGYVAPIFLFSGVFFYMSNRGNARAMLKLLAAAMGLAALCGFSQMLLGPPFQEGQRLAQFYQASAGHGQGGGFLGGALSLALSSIVGKAGAYLVLLVVLVISLVCITEKSFVNAVRKGGGKAYQHAKEDMGRRRIQQEERRRQREEEQRIRGVNLNATKLQDAAEPSAQELSESAGGLGEELAAATGALEEEAQENLAFGGSGWPGAIQADGMAGGPGDGWSEESQAALMAGTVEDALAGAGQSWDEGIQAAPRAGTHFGLGRGVGGMDGGSWDAQEEPRAEVAQAWVSQSQDQDQELARGRAGRFSAAMADAGLDDEEDEVPFIPDHEFPGGQGMLHKQDTIYAERDTRTLEEMDVVGIPGDSLADGSFFIPDEPKRVVTANGRIIETDTEALEKRLESKRAQKAAEDGPGLHGQLASKELEVEKEYVFPLTTLLKKGGRGPSFSEREYRETAMKLQQTLKNFGVGVTVTNISCGPSVTRYELQPEQGVKVSRIVSLADDIKLNLAAADIRIEAPIPGKAAVGIEVPNKENNLVYLRDLLESQDFTRHPSRLAFAVGKDIGGQVVVADIAKMPHLLIAGATGSGKSVCINTLVMSILYKADPKDVKLIMVDPKVVELSVYNGIPHLLIPVVTDPKKASGALNWAVAEMTDRYQKFAQYNVRDIKGYNARVAGIQDLPGSEKPKNMPQIVIIIDELADLMMVAPGEVEDSICRLAQLARAAGIHLVIATQRPSVNVITGLIKANVPSRIAFSVSSGVDSRTIIDMNGAEKLLGKGDMLFYPAGYPKPIRVQGAFVSDQEVSRVVEFLTQQGMTAQYSQEVEHQIAMPPEVEARESEGGRDEYFVQAGRFIIEKDKASIGMLQRMFKIGFNRAARIMDQLAKAGVVGEEESTKPRKVLMTMEEFEELAGR